MKLWVDLETRSTLNLKLVGVYKYASRCEITLISWAADDGPVQVDEKLTPEFWDAFCQADEIVAHNAEFDRTVLAARNPGIDIRFDRWYCTAAQARRHGLPGGLGALCDIFHIPVEQAKMKDSRRLMLTFCKPDRHGVWKTKDTHPAEWERFRSYGGLDVEAMRAVHKAMPRWNDAAEREVWLADQRINQRGFLIDREFVAAAVTALRNVSQRADEETLRATLGQVGSARQVQALLQHILAEYGVALPDMTSLTLEQRANDPDLPDGVRELIQLRQLSGKTSTSKFTTLLRCIGDDGRLRGSMTYSGAMRTQRWAGSKFQPHNLPRPQIGNLRGQALKDEIASGIDAVRAGVYDLVGTYPLPAVLSSAIRGCLVAPSGEQLTVGDYSNVEGRGLAWLAGEEWKLQAFRDYDAGTGPDLYKVAYSNSFDIPVEDVDDGTERQIGKVQELMLGYQGGVGAFITGAATYRIDLAVLPKKAWPLVPVDVRDEACDMWDWAVLRHRTLGLPRDVFLTCDAIKRLWRRRHPMIVQFWNDLEDAFAAAVQGQVSTVRSLQFSKQNSWVRILLPSGRYLSYPGARYADEELSYVGVDAYTKQWQRIGTYGGKLAENITQALCRDLLRDAIVAADKAGDPIVLHVHDELVGENIAPARLEALMTQHSPWAAGFPLAVKVSQMARYHKD